MIDLLARAAADAPQQVAVVTEAETVTYSELASRARRVAAALREHGPDLGPEPDLEPGLETGAARLVIVEPDAATVLALLAGAAAAGVETCQLQPDLAAAEVLNQTAALAPAVLCTQRADLGGSGVLSPAVLQAGAVPQANAVLQAGAPADAVLPPAAQRSAAQPLLIRTTGSSGAPKAVRHDWRALSAPLAAQLAEPVRPDERWLLAYGLHQFAGIQVLLHVLARRATLIAPFPRQPRDGLRALTAPLQPLPSAPRTEPPQPLPTAPRVHATATHVSATPTWWRFLLAQARAEQSARAEQAALPALRQVTLGGEPASADLLRDLSVAFPTARITQVYASTEWGSIVAVNDGRPGFAAVRLLSDANPGATLRVVDGELWVRSASPMLGYADAADAPDADPAAPIAAPADSDTWRRTGDLVEVVGDRVLFRGRDSEVINVGGVKVHPLPIEERIAALDGVAAARVFGRANRLTGAIVAAEVVPVGGVGGADEGRVRDLIRDAVADLPRAWHPRSVRLVDEIVTIGTKTVRRAQA